MFRCEACGEGMVQVASQCPHCSAWQAGAVSHRSDIARTASGPRKFQKPKARPRQATPRVLTDDQKWARAVLRSVGFLWASDIEAKLAPFTDRRVRELIPKRSIRWWWHIGSTALFVMFIAFLLQQEDFFSQFANALFILSIGGHAWVAARGYFSGTAAREARAQELRKVLSSELHTARIELLKDGPFGPPQAPPPGREVDGVDDREAEHLCARWLANLGEENVRVTRAKSDGGVDIVSSRCVAQVKNYAGSVGVGPVRELVGVASTDGRFPVFFTSGNYTKAAKQFAEQAKVYLFRYDAKAGTLDAESSIAEKAFER